MINSTGLFKIFFLHISISFEENTYFSNFSFFSNIFAKFSVYLPLRNLGPFLHILAIWTLDIDLSEKKSLLIEDPICTEPSESVYSRWGEIMDIFSNMVDFFWNIKHIFRTFKKHILNSPGNDDQNLCLFLTFVPCLEKHISFIK